MACPLGAERDRRTGEWHGALAEQDSWPFGTVDVVLRGPRFTLTLTTPPEGTPMLDELLPAGIDRSHDATTR
ncbi:hypothetical protein GCM10009613_05460 [Pseudonocardia kongjuensis]|uniref:Uncharacterized protein n=1 Tax=Pseudonocardia kongjuensis TaxID=102227 RepID=A0ABN1XI85_9PSEU